MKILLRLCILFSLSLISCSTEQNEDETKTTQEETDINEKVMSKEELSASIQEQKLDMMDDERQDLKKLNRLLAYCMMYVNDYSDDKNAPEYLDLAAQLAYAKGTVVQSVAYYERLIENYPDYKNLEYALFMYASHLDLDLRKIEEATKAYQSFIEKFPNSKLIEQAQSRIENIDKSMEDIIGL